MKEQLLETVNTSRQYTLQVASAMPEAGWKFKPVDTVWDFRELMHHIAYGIQWWEANYIKGKETAWEPTPVKKNKMEVMEYLETAYDSLAKAIENSTIDDSVVKGVFATLDHITHHRGQATIHLRMNGITPPEYTF